jgi:parvulin-like peptidyl-prolyl isomerase
MSDYYEFSTIRRFTGRLAVSLALSSFGCLLCLPLFVTGCGGSKDKVLAKVGDREITTAYYEERLSKLKQNELPRGEDNLPVDTSTLAGKKAFLDVIINKELMALRAIEMGYDSEEQITGAQKAMMEYHAGQLLHEEVIDKPTNVISDEQLEYYYSRLPEVRECSFIICNFREDAVKARQAVLDGGLWEDVAEQYHDGSMSPSGDYKVKVTWGRWEDSFEEAIYSLEVGEVSQPIETVYGHWIVRLEKKTEEKVPPLESIQDRVLNSIKMRSVNLARKEFMRESRAKHDFKLSEDALWIIYQGLPEGELILDPETQQPIPREQLKPLDIPLEDMDVFLYQVRLDGELQSMTVGDYKVLFDKMSTFQRPKKSEMLGGLRLKLTQDIEKQLVVQEAKERGYFQDERVLEKVGIRLEEMMVSKLHSDVVKYEEYVSPDDLEAYWVEVKDQYIMPEGRDGAIVYCRDLETAQQAHAAAVAGTDWEEILEKYGKDEANKGRNGLLEMVRANHAHPIRDALWSLEKKGDISEPFQVEKNWAVVRLGTIEEPYQRELAEVTNELGQRIKMRRQDEALRKLLQDWRKQYNVVIDESNLAKVRSWEELSLESAGLPVADAS